MDEQTSQNRFSLRIKKKQIQKKKTKKRKRKRKRKIFQYFSSIVCMFYDLKVSEMHFFKG